MSVLDDCGWGVYEDCPDGNVHIIPIDGDGKNIMGHEVSALCWCKPFVESGLVVHSEPLWPGSKDPLPSIH